MAAVQLNSQQDLTQNLANVAAEVRAAAERGAKLVVLPENFAYMGSEVDKRAFAEELPSRDAPIQSCLRQLAEQHRVALLAGGFPERSGDPLRPFNTCVAYGPDGSLLGAYRKIHLFDVDLPDGTRLLESEGVSPGSDPVVIEVAGFKVGLSICYDVRFPELYRALTQRGAELLIVPAAFTLQTGKDHWHVLLRARAIESQCWLIAAGQWGRHPQNRATYGHSMIIDPWGTIVAEASDRTGVVVADVDRDYLDKVRRSVPCLRHRRL